MDYGDDYWALYRGYYRDPFPHSLLSTRQQWVELSARCSKSKTPRPVPTNILPAKSPLAPEVLRVSRATYILKTLNPEAKTLNPKPLNP